MQNTHKKQGRGSVAVVLAGQWWTMRCREKRPTCSVNLALFRWRWRGKSCFEFFMGKIEISCVKKQIVGWMTSIWSVSNSSLLGIMCLINVSDSGETKECWFGDGNMKIPSQRVWVRRCILFSKYNYMVQILNFLFESKQYSYGAEGDDLPHDLAEYIWLFWYTTFGNYAGA